VKKLYLVMGVLCLGGTIILHAMEANDSGEPPPANQEDIALPLNRNQRAVWVASTVRPIAIENSAYSPVPSSVGALTSPLSNEWDAPLYTPVEYRSEGAMAVDTIAPLSVAMASGQTGLAVPWLKVEVFRRSFSRSCSEESLTEDSSSSDSRSSARSGETSHPITAVARENGLPMSGEW